MAGELTDEGRQTVWIITSTDDRRFEEAFNLMVLKTQPERIATIRRMAALPGSGVRPDQALAIAQAFEKLIDEPDGGSTGSAK